MKVLGLLLLVFSANLMAMPELYNDSSVDEICETDSAKIINIQEQIFHVLCSAQDLLKISQSDESLKGNYILGSDIDLSELIEKSGEFKIGDGTYQSKAERSFSGIFDGNAHTISNFKYVSPGEYYVGLFGHTRSAVIRNLRLDNTQVQSKAYTGSLIGKAIETTVENVVSTNVWVRGHRVQGGLIGSSQFDVYLDEDDIRERMSQGTEHAIKSVFVSGFVKGDSLSTGGVSGYNHYPISDAGALVRLEGSETSSGYIVGYNFEAELSDTAYFPLDFDYIYGGKVPSQERSFADWFFGIGDRYFSCGNDKYDLKSKCLGPKNTIFEVEDIKAILEVYPVDLNSEPSFY